MAVVTPSDRHVYLSSEHAFSWSVTEDEDGAITVGKQKLERLLNEARVFLPMELVEKDWQNEEYFRHHMGQMAQEVDTIALMMNFKNPTVVPKLSAQSLNETEPGAAMNSTGVLTGENETMLQQVFRVLFKRELEELYSTLEPSNVECLLDGTLASGENCPASTTLTKNLTTTSVAANVVEEEAPVTTPTTSSTAMDDLTILSVAEEETPTNNPTEAAIEITESDSTIEVSENVMISSTPGSDLSTSSAFVSEPSAVEEVKDENTLIKTFLKKVRNLKDVTPPQVSQVLFDLTIAEEDVSEVTAIKSLPNSVVRSRTILLNSGLGWTIPKSSAEAFEDELTQHPISPILQRVYDSNRTIFWVPVKFGVPKRKFSEPENFTDGNATEPSYREDTDTTLIDDENEVRSTEQMNVTEIPSQPVPVTVFKSVDLPWRDGLFKAGVMGLTLHPEFLPHHLRQLSLCSDESHNTCYLLDDAGYIVAVNNESLNYQIGHFLGAADPPLMRALLENNIYDSIIDYNFQGRCEPIDSEDAPESAGVRLKSFFLSGRRQALAVALFSYWWITDDLQFVKWPRAFATAILLPFGEVAAMQLEPSNCIQQIHRYFVPHQENPDMFENITDSSSSWTRTTGGIINCSIDCVRDWKAVDIEGTNLKLIIASQACSENCSHLDERVPSGPVESDGPDVCQEVRNPRYRKSTGPCPLTDLVHTNLECGICRVQCSFVLLIFSLLSVYFSPD
ncbi:voltage-dependent calcium channel subunit alpha-2/delta-1 [Clonorchis sinensis]|uniref:Voltage-dependent calcium channel subunit alpha-2/delta-1 n=1 Tax=Clonorchis sinensis TaxID=79923 RepID=G7YF15_CLOSI|nr:voltage-dependent calcium channel subunit alpha-2/delta-1 [Clonorchis sinensis]